MFTSTLADDEPQVFEDMHSRTWMKALHPDAIVLCDFNNEIVQPPGPLKYVDRLLVVYASPEAARWRWAEKDIKCVESAALRPHIFIQESRFTEMTADLPIMSRCLRRPISLLSRAFWSSLREETHNCSHRQFLFSQCVGDPEGRHMLKLSTLIGPSIRHLMRYRKYAEERVTSHFRQMAQDVTSDLLALTATLRNEMVLNAKQAQNFHHFFFMTASSTSASLELPSPKLPHKVGTQWLLRLIRQAICEKQDPIGDNLLTSISSSNSTVFGAAYEAVLLRKVKDGRLYCDYTTPNESGLRLPHVAAESAQDPTRLYTEVYLDQSADLPILRDSSRFFVTVAPNFPTVDAVTVTFTHVQLLQLTVATRHRVQQSGLDGIYQLMERNNLLQGRKWHFIFVAPRKESADALCSSASARKLAAYAHSKLRLNFCFGSMPVPLRRPVSRTELNVRTS